MKRIDARGLACPAPVLQTRAALDQESVQAVKVIIDNVAAQQNVSRFLTSRGFQTQVLEEGADYIVVGRAGDTTRPAASGPAALAQETDHPAAAKIMVMIAADRLGAGDDRLGAKLMINFIRTLKEMGSELWRLVFVNSGVKLAVSGSEVLDDLKDLDAAGIHILVCGTCLTHFNLLDQKQVGETTNMLDIVTAMQLADKVVNL
jgi:selenium metabolism protein YedF